jgi:plastocyanin
MPTPRRRAARWAVPGMTALLGLSLASGAFAQSEPADQEVGVAVSGLAAAEVVTGNRIDLVVEPVGFELSAAHAGSPHIPGIGHYHVILDGALINMFTTTDASVSLRNVTAGPHTLMVIPATNDHMDIMEGAAAIEFDFRPDDPLPDITAADGLDGAPGISIVSPRTGDTVTGPFDIVVEATNLTLSEELLGKPNVDGYGHWHVFVDAAESMATMAGMSGTDTLAVDPSALPPGTHAFIAVLVDNLHAPFDPPVMAVVELEVAPGSTGDGAEGVAISLLEWGLEPSSLTLAAGTYEFTATNDGTIDHALALAGDGVAAGTPDAAFAAGVSQSFVVELAPGTYELYCPIPGHKDAGMVGTLTVVG